MWLLRKLNDGSTKYLISQNNFYTVGRKNCDITLEDDASISRKHCTFYVAKAGESSSNKNAPTRVWVLDESSKYGTFVKDNNIWVQLNANERKSLTDGSILRFGMLESIWRLEYKPIIACASGVPVEQRRKVDSILQSIDGCLRNSWCKECTLVIANDTTLTEKVVLALINGVPLVTPAYTEKLVECVNKQIKLPNYKNYQPDIKESILDKSLVSLDTENQRRDLFKGKKFVIPTRKQLETFKKIIECAGGTVELLPTHAWESLADDDVVVIQLPLNNSDISEQLTKSFKEMSLFLKTNYGKRIVPESEIALAVAYSSTEKFCNPKSTCFNLKIGERKEVDLGPVIVEDTPISTEEVKLSQPGMVCASATYDSEIPLCGNMESQPSGNKNTELQRALAGDLPIEGQNTSSTAGQKSQAHLPQRKRTHNSDSQEHETLSKRARNPDTSTKECREAEKKSSSENRGSCDNLRETEGKDNPSNAAEAESPCGTNYFKTRNALLPGSIRVTRQSVSDFWECTTHKRKISSENHDSGDDSMRKKAKVLERLNSRERTPEILPSEEVDESGHQRSSVVRYRSAQPLPSGRTVKDVEEEDNFADYFGKEISDTDLLDLNNTILSLAIISPSFLKEDGSLADPPDVPVNVKRFKKKKVSLASAVNPLEDEELSDGEWLEPHSDRLNVSVPGEVEY